ncbi:MAG: hypothetical protein OEW46_11960 [Actinomycetota bacterium]|nr:hypothetical protein [Actinomycetota bacterium]
MPEPSSTIDRARIAASSESWAEAYELFGSVDRSEMKPADLAAFADAA